MDILIIKCMHLSSITITKEKNSTLGGPRLALSYGILLLLTL